VLKWAREHGCPWDIMVFVYAESGHHIELIMWAKENGCPGGDEYPLDY
jgi:hypothetical protein